MRLIDVSTHQLKEFFGPSSSSNTSSTPRYAILSHTWGSEEVTFQDWEILLLQPKSSAATAIRHKAGYTKITNACLQAARDGFQYLWCDTNCIDKRSSAELSEAINSMFAWYRDSAVCHAFLADVQVKTNTFQKSRWFTRGWTLQELLAPSEVIFFDCRWVFLGTRKTLAKIISDITRIHIGALDDRDTIYDYSIAQRMSWAADRQTTRAEDVAYCLLGIFDINMPLLYGEGGKAFCRLQEEIIKLTNDQSLLAWDAGDPYGQPNICALAPSPAEFRFCGSIVRHPEVKKAPYSKTNMGLSLSVPMVTTYTRDIVLVGLNCAEELGRTTVPSERPMKISRKFRVWIAICHLKYDQYVRKHYPASRVLLYDAYAFIKRPAVIDLFLAVDVPRLMVDLPGKSYRSEQPTHYHSTSPSRFGAIITISAGRVLPHAQTFKEVYSLPYSHIQTLKGRGLSTLSHALVHSGDFTVVLSAFWNQSGQPVEWLYTSVADPLAQVTTEMATQEEWKCLFKAETNSHPSHCCNTVSAMHSLHKRLRDKFSRAVAQQAIES